MDFTWKFHYNWKKKVVQVHNLDGNKVAVERKADISPHHFPWNKVWSNSTICHSRTGESLSGRTRTGRHLLPETTNNQQPPTPTPPTPCGLMCSYTTRVWKPVGVKQQITTCNRVLPPPEDKELRSPQTLFISKPQTSDHFQHFSNKLWSTCLLSASGSHKHKPSSIKSTSG